MDTSSLLLIGGAIAGAIGGWLTGGMLKSLSLGNTISTIIGVVGGIVVGYWLHTMFPGLAGSDGNVSLPGLVGQLVGALASGGIFVAICALVKDLLSPKSMS